MNDKAQGNTGHVPTWTHTVDCDAGSLEFLCQFVREHDVGELRVLVRLQPVVGVLLVKQQIFHVQRLQLCKTEAM